MGRRIGRVSRGEGMKNKIGWCDMTWNPVWGCRNHCEYCYARIFAKRFYDVIADKEYQFLYWNRMLGTFCTGGFANKLRHFVPTFIKSNFYKKFPKKPQRIFVGSMSEINHWKNEWMSDVLDKINKYPQHTFQFLTKFPKVYLNFSFPKNCWLGITIVGDIDKIEYQKFKISNPDNLKYVSFEPLLNKISINLEGIDWIIIGAETGNRKEKVIPKRKWFEKIVYCHGRTTIYIKDNLLKYYPEYRGYKQFPNITKL